MVRFSESRRGAVLLILLGIGILTSGFLLFSSPNEVEYRHEVEKISGGEMSPDEVVNHTEHGEPTGKILNYSSLSPEAKDVFLDALESNDPATLIHPGPLPPEFSYPDDTGPKSYYIHYQGAYYVLTTSQGHGTGSLQVLTVPIGTAVIVLGIGLWVIEPEWSWASG